MAIFPTLPTPTVVNLDYTGFIILDESEGGYTTSRRRSTKIQQNWELQWTGTTSLSEANKNTLLAFINTNLGGSFTWAHPVSGEYTVIITDPNIPVRPPMTKLGYYDVTLKIREV